MSLTTPHCTTSGCSTHTHDNHGSHHRCKPKGKPCGGDNVGRGVSQEVGHGVSQEPLPAPVARLLESVRLHWPAAEGLECRSDGESVVLDIAPLPGRAVVFMSGAVDHAVLPVEGGLRAALTAWMQ